MNKIITILLAFAIIAGFALGDEDLLEPCVSNAECQIAVSGPVYCDSQTQTCFLNSTVLATPPTANTSTASINVSNASTTVSNVTNATSNVTTIDQTLLNNLQRKLSEAERQLTSLQQQINTINTKTNQIDTTLNTVNSNLQNVDSQQTQSKEELKKDLTGVSTGLAGLQTEVTQTKTELNQVQEALNTNGVWITIITLITLVLVAAFIAVFVAYYVVKKRKADKIAPRKLTPRIQSYITQQIRIGKKYPMIKEELMKAGWNEEEVKWAYQETTKSNYQSFIGKAQ